ncbi:MFS transporter [Streptomyces sp. 8L]|uniref:MFS transporter n=1 Tax=Streptomyces sp. 8L TaxID=2877242 RepID=UPI001CD3C46E|nr:MFS transporter [Streptomyces sp. 8L]MCA1221072.1 MFS transporter [Streptomyces sp. 8L]
MTKASTPAVSGTAGPAITTEAAGAPAAPGGSGAPGAGDGAVVHHHGSVLGPLGLFTVLLGAALPLIDFFIVNVALPTIEHDLDASPAVLELVVAGYGLSYAVLLVLGGRLGDMFGRRRLFIAGMAAFGLTSLACGLAPDAWSLVGARVAQGAASALMLPQVLATIHSSTTGHRRARALSMYGATAGLSMVAGQILGGVLVAADIGGSGWRAIFLVNVPVALVGLFLAVRSVPETRSQAPAPIDVPGTALLAASLTSLLLPLTEGRASGWPAWTWVSLAAFPFLAYALYQVERRADRAGRTPLVPPSLFQLVPLRRGLVLIVPFSIGFGGFMFVFTVALQQGLGMGAVAAGVALVPLAVGFFAASLSGPRLVLRLGSRVVALGGVLQALGLALLAYQVWRDWPSLGTLALLPGTALAGLGQGLQLPVLFRIVLSDVPAERAGVGSGVMVTTQQSMLALGVATLGSLFLTLSGTGSPHMGHALAVTLLTQLGLVALTALLALRLPRQMA